MGTFVQQVEDTIAASAGSISSPTFGANRTAGNLLWFCFAYTSGAARTITYSGALTGAVETGNHYNLADTQGLRWGYVKNIAGGAATAGTGTFSANVTFRGIYIAEWSGFDTSNPASGTSVSARQVNPGASANAISSGTLTPGAQPGTLIGFGLDWSSSDVPAAGSGFNSRTAVWDFDIGVPFSTRPEDKAITSTSAVAATFTSAASHGGDTYYSIADYFIDAGGADVLMAQVMM